MQRHDLSFRAMASPCRLRVYHAQGEAAVMAAAAARDEVIRIEHKYSRYRADSVLTAINATAGCEATMVDEETAALLDYAAAAYAESGGVFDITSGVLRKAWDFRSGRLPEEAEVDALLDCVGWRRVDWQRPRIQLPSGVQLDFGGFGKEYAVDCAAAVLRQHGVAHGLVDLGGDIRMLGPHPDGSAWRVGIRDPADAQRALVSLDLSAGAIATSGDYERGMVIGGRLYSHLLDPRSGWPVDSPYRSVSVLAPQCLVAGTAASVALLRGMDGPDWLDALGLPWLAVGADGSLTRSSV